MYGQLTVSRNKIFQVRSSFKYLTFRYSHMQHNYAFINIYLLNIYLIYLLNIYLLNMIPSTFKRQDLQKKILCFTEPKRYTYFTYHEDRQKCCHL